MIFVGGLKIESKFGSPYPAIVFPSFAAVPGVSRPIRTPRLKVFFTNQDSLEVNTTELFYHLPDYFSNVILQENFTKERSFFSSRSSKKKISFKNKPQATSIKKNNDIQHNKRIDECVFWIKNRLTQIVKRTDPNRFEVQWYDYSFKLSNKPVKDSLVEKFIVNLN